MQRILVTGAAGQIGSELVPELRRRYGNENVIAARSSTLPCPQTSGSPAHVQRSTYRTMSRSTAPSRTTGSTTIYHLSSLLSALAEQRRQAAYRVNIQGLYNILEAAVNSGLERVIVPSSIAAFGPDTPAESYAQ